MQWGWEVLMCGTKEILTVSNYYYFYYYYYFHLKNSTILHNNALHAPEGLSRNLSGVLPGCPAAHPGAKSSNFQFPVAEGHEWVSYTKAVTLKHMSTYSHPFPTLPFLLLIKEKNQQSRKRKDTSSM